MREESSGNEGGRPTGVKTPPSSPLPKYQDNPALVQVFGHSKIT